MMDRVSEPCRLSISAPYRMNLNDSDLLWFVALVGVAIGALAIGYWVHWIAGMIFWGIATLILLALRPY